MSLRLKTNTYRTDHSLKLERIDIFFLFPHEKQMLWVLIRSAEALLMSTNNICFRGEIRKKIYLDILSSGAKVVAQEYVVAILYNRLCKRF